MARRKKVSDLPPGDVELARLPAFVPLDSAYQPQAPQVPLPTPTEERRERELEELLDEIGTDGRIAVWHVIDGKATFAGNMSLDGFSLDTLLEAFGGGDKSLVFYQGKRRVDTLRVSLDPSIPPTSPRSGRMQATHGAPQQPGQGPAELSGIATVLASMAQMSVQSMQASQQMMTGMIGAITALMTARPEKDPLDLAIKMAELTKSNNPPATPATELFSVFEKGMALAKRFEGGNDSDGTLGVIREGLGIVGKVVEAHVTAKAVADAQAGATSPRPGNAVAVVAAPHGVSSGDEPGNGADVAERTGRAADAASLAESESGAVVGSIAGIAGGDAVSANDRPWVAAARPSLPLLNVAIGNYSADTVAGLIMDRLDDDALSDLLADVNDGTPLQFVERFRVYFAHEPYTPEVQAWLVECAECIKDDGADGDDTTDVAGDGAPG